MPASKPLKHLNLSEATHSKVMQVKAKQKLKTADAVIRKAIECLDLEA